MADTAPASANPAEVRLPVEVEPQNELTQKFTEKDWGAVKELRVHDEPTPLGNSNFANIWDVTDSFTIGHRGCCLQGS